MLYINSKKSLKILKGQTTQRSNEKGKKDTQCSTKDTHKAKDIVTRTPYSQVPFNDFYI